MAIAQWTPRVTARSELAETLRDKYPDRAEGAGLVRHDLDGISTHGRKAIQADRLQKEQLAQIDAERTLRKDVAQDVSAREDALRDRLPAVIGELTESSQANERELGLWLGNLSFARYRFREIKPTITLPPDDASEPCGEGEISDAASQELRSVRRVERADVVTRMNGLEAFSEALLRPGREPIVKLLATRGLPPEDLRALADDARTLADMGRNVKRAAEATAVESEAAQAQLRIWQRVRRMMRKAVQGVPELEKKWAEC